MPHHAVHTLVISVGGCGVGTGLCQSVSCPVMLLPLCSSTVAMAGERPESSDLTMGQGHFLSKNFNAERSSLTRKNLDSVSPTPAIANSTASPFTTNPPFSHPIPHASVPESWAVESDPLLGLNSTQTSASAEQQRQNAAQMQTKSSFAAVSGTQSQPSLSRVQPSASAHARSTPLQPHVAPLEPAMRPQSASGSHGLLQPTPTVTHNAASTDLRPNTSAALFSGMSVAPSSLTGAPPSSVPHPRATPTPPQWHQHTSTLAPSAALHASPTVPAAAQPPQAPSLFTNMSMGYSAQQLQQSPSAATLPPTLMPTTLTPQQGTFETSSQPQMPSFPYQGTYSSVAPQTFSTSGAGGPLWGGNQGTLQTFTAPLPTVTPLSKQDLEDLLS